LTGWASIAADDGDRETAEAYLENAYTLEARVADSAVRLYTVLGERKLADRWRARETGGRPELPDSDLSRARSPGYDPSGNIAEGRVVSEAWFGLLGVVVGVLLPRCGHGLPSSVRNWAKLEGPQRG
jgi:hypothetical protein